MHTASRRRKASTTKGSTSFPEVISEKVERGGDEEDEAGSGSKPSAAKRKRADQMSKTGESSNKVRAPRVTRSMSRDLDDNDDAEEVVYAVKVRVVRGHDLDYN